MSEVPAALSGITWLGHSGLRVQGKLTLYFDPYLLGDGLPKADVVFLTHPHFDHCSIDDVAKIATAQTIVAGPRECVAKFRLNQLPLTVGETRRVLGASVTALPACNAKQPHHPKGKGWLGFLVEAEGRKLYHAGDTEELDAMDGLAPDVAFLPVDNLYTMGVPQAVKAAQRVRAKLTVPIHFGTLCGSRMEAGRFVTECERAGLAAAFPPGSPATGRERAEDALPTLAARVEGA